LHEEDGGGRGQGIRDKKERGTRKPKGPGRLLAGEKSSRIAVPGVKRGGSENRKRRKVSSLQKRRTKKKEEEIQRTPTKRSLREGKSGKVIVVLKKEFWKTGRGIV